MVEEQSNVLQETKRNLEGWGYEPILVKDLDQCYDVETLRQKAKEAAYNNACHLALTGLAIFDDGNNRDESGFAVAEVLRPIPSIIVSAYLNAENVRKGLKLKRDGVIDTVEKAKGPRTLKESLDEHLPQYCYYTRPNFKIHYIGDAQQKVNQLGKFKAVADEVEELLSRLFPDNENRIVSLLEVRSLSQNTISPSSRLITPSSLILKVRFQTADKRWSQPILVKIAHQTSIDREAKKYDKYVKDQLGGNFHPHLKESKMAWKLGGLSMSYQGNSDQLVTFSAYYQEKTEARIKEVLRKIFAEIWRGHYEQRQTDRDGAAQRITEAYITVWDEEKKEPRLFETRLQNHLEHNNFSPAKIILNGWQFLPNPLAWLKERHATSPICTRYAITHGDLHGENIIIGGDDHPRLVDFERTGWGPLLQDFVELEGDILIRLLDYGKKCDIELTTYLHWLIQLYSPQKLGPLNGLRERSTDLLNKAQTTVGFLRSTAKRYHDDPKQYYWGVLLNAIYRMIFILERPDEVRPNFDQQYERAYLLAAILCHRLERWERSDWGNRLSEKLEAAERKKEQ